ncbi:hypothetical protein J2W30_004554 [Variovorax boronicumulans]|nr:hypothetical protein [Variovorax boronicumulans]MDQ0036779.1 hypothetical protein [Variovorax boronicumulans]MDQ0044544.1 hypothetical protein [Variovorax boronicumulans]
MPAIRPAGEIVAELSERRCKPAGVSRKARETLAAGLPPDLLSLVDDLGGQEIAGDFMLLDLSQVLRETAERDHPMIELGKTWWVFGTSGTGDAWLLRRTEHGSQVAFLDHDQGCDALPLEMGLDFAQWLQLADLMAQVEQPEQGIADSANADNIARELNRLSEGLSGRYPYRLDV